MKTSQPHKTVYPWSDTQILVPVTILTSWNCVLRKNTNSVCVWSSQWLERTASCPAVSALILQQQSVVWVVVARYEGRGAVEENFWAIFFSLFSCCVLFMLPFKQALRWQDCVCGLPLFRKQVLIFCYCVSERWSLQLSLILVLLTRKKKKVSSLPENRK